jgi:hypothetical protein
MKRQRETDLKDKARQKRERRAAKAETPTTGVTKGPAIAWDEAVRYVESPTPPSDVSVVPTDDSSE